MMMIIIVLVCGEKNLSSWKLDWCSENSKEESILKWINEDSILKCYEVLSDEDIVL